MADEDKAIEQRLDEFTGHLASCQTQLLAYVFALVHNMADAEDICQRSSIILWQKFDQYEVGTEFRLWALKITQYEAFNFIRKRRRERIYFSDETLQAIAKSEDSEMAVQAHESKWKALKHCIDRLPVNQKEIVCLYYGGAKTTTQLASDFGRSNTAIRSALCRARKLLRNCVELTLQEEFA